MRFWGRATLGPVLDRGLRSSSGTGPSQRRSVRGRAVEVFPPATSRNRL